MLPLIHNNRVYALFLVGRLDHIRIFHPFELQLLRHLMQYSLVAMINSFYYDMVRQLSIDLWDANERLNEKINTSTSTLETTLRQVQMLYDEQSDFFTMALHNIRTPLTSITAAATILWRSQQSKPQESIYRILTDNIHRLNALALDVVEIAKLDSLNLSHYYLKFDISNVVNQLFDQFKQNFAHKYIDCQINRMDDINYIHGESEQIKLIFYHLLANAFKFTHDGGRITVTLKIASKKDLAKYGLASVNHPGDYYEFSVKDTGRGIPAEEQDHIFDSFVQGLNSRSTRASTGLGLYIVKRCAEHHGGAVTFHSIVDVGSTFYVILPV